MSLGELYHVGVVSEAWMWEQLRDSLREDLRPASTDSIFTRRAQHLPDNTSIAKYYILPTLHVAKCFVFIDQTQVRRRSLAS